MIPTGLRRRTAYLASTNLLRYIASSSAPATQHTQIYMLRRSSAGVSSPLTTRLTPRIGHDDGRRSTIEPFQLARRRLQRSGGRAWWLREFWAEWKFSTLGW